MRHLQSGSAMLEKLRSALRVNQSVKKARSGANGHRVQKLHLGSGSIRLEGWLNIDIDATQADLKLDLRNPLPCADNSVRFVFSEHFIEHITRPEAVRLLRECWRVLVPGGTLRLSTPSLQWIVAKYLERNLAEWGDLWRPATPCQLMNEGLRSWGHQFVYDADELRDVLAEAGFATVEWVGWRQSRHPELNNLEQRPYHQELIAEATK